MGDSNIFGISLPLVFGVLTLNGAMTPYDIAAHAGMYTTAAIVSITSLAMSINTSAGSH